MTDIELGWLAGILEGEGCFGFQRNSPFVTMATTDRDIIERARSLTLCTGGIYFYQNKNANRKMIYSIKIHGKQAIRIMKLIRPHMGTRRGEIIDNILSEAPLGKRILKAVS